MKIYGKVIEIDDSPIPGATVSIVSSSGNPIAAMAADSNGNFNFGDTDYSNTSRLIVTDVAHDSQSSPIGSLGSCPVLIYLSKKGATLQEVVVVAYKNKATKRGFMFYAVQVVLIVILMKISSKYF